MKKTKIINKQKLAYYQTEMKLVLLGFVKKNKIYQKFTKILKVFLKIGLWPVTGWRKWPSLSLAVLLIFGFVYLLRELPSPTNLTSSENYAVSTKIYDRNHVLLYEIFGDENRSPITLEELPDYIVQATIAIEDKRFYHHLGFDLTGILRAGIKNARGESVEGGSTITQQLVKNALLTREKTVKRKLKELFLSVITEIIYSKRDILEMYLNYIPYGGTAVGIEAASQQYFNKPAKDLSLAEASVLAGLPQAPSKYSPFQSNQSAAKNRQAEVLRRMVEDGYITLIKAEEAKSTVLRYALSKTDIKAPHFVFYVRDKLIEEYGVEKVEKGGLRVTTSLDLSIQNAAQASLSAEVETLKSYHVSNGASLVINPQTGEILSMVGSKDFFDAPAEGQVNVTLAERQPGSSIKPIMYATAFQAGILNPGTILVDNPICFDIPGQKQYCPKNYDGKFRGAVTVRQALGNSLNIPAVKSLKAIGLENFIDQAREMGITSWKDPSRYGLSLTLGGGEIKMIDLAQAFSVLANQGVKVPLNPILRVEDYKDNLLYDLNLEQRRADLVYLTKYEDEINKGELNRVMSRAPAYLTSHIMQDNPARNWAFGPNSKLVIKDQVVSVKTGTTNNLKDNWTVGFTPEFLVATWVGNNNGDPMNQYLVSGVTGAAPIWHDIMAYLLENREPIWQEKPPDVKSDQVCFHGFPQQGDEPCQSKGKELFWEQSHPSAVQLIKQQIWVDPSTGQPPPPDVNVDGLIVEEHIFFQDPLSEKLECIDCSLEIEIENFIL